MAPIAIIEFVDRDETVRGAKDKARMAALKATEKTEKTETIPERNLRPICS